MSGLVLAAQELPESSALAYRVVWEGMGDHPLLPLLQDRSRSVRLRQVPPATRRQLELRMQNDVPVLQDTLAAQGYFLAEVQGRVEDTETGVQIVFDCRPGPSVRIGHLKIVYPEGRIPRASWSPVLKPGDPVNTMSILAAEQRALRFFRSVGHPFPVAGEREILIDPETALAAVTFHFDPGPALRYGELSLAGADSVSGRFFRRQQLWTDRDWYDFRELEDFENDLIQSGLFSRVTVEPVAAQDAEAVDLRVTVTERHPRTVRLGADYRTDVGFGVNAAWEHRNAWGSGERFQMRGLIAEKEQELETMLRLPGFKVRNQSLLLRAQGASAQTDAFESESMEGYLGVERAISRTVTWRVGTGLRYADVEQGPVREEYGLVLLPLQMFRDSTDDDLNPVRGSRWTAEVTPTTEVLAGDISYARIQLSGSRYLQLRRRPQVIMAGRVTLGVLAGAEFGMIPADERYYSGGGGSVRGYVYQDIGPKVAGTPVGGTALAELVLETRIRLTEMLGFAFFVDGGQVTQSDLPLEETSMNWAAGMGLRLFTGFGPLRLDAAYPLNAEESQVEDIQVYISLGQAF
ncbi:MAG: autotransporter assembly complex protein TamA [Kiritimatiellia bacterium]